MIKLREPLDGYIVATIETTNGPRTLEDIEIILGPAEDSTVDDTVTFIVHLPEPDEWGGEPPTNPDAISPFEDQFLKDMQTAGRKLSAISNFCYHLKRLIPDYFEMGFGDNYSITFEVPAHLVENLELLD